MQPLKITAIMQDGRIAGTEPWFPLDSILASAWMRRHYPEAYYNASSHLLTNEMIIADLPFDRRGKDDNWYWACSFNTAPPIFEYVMHWHKRFDDDLEKYLNFKGRRGKIDTKSGRLKSYRMPLIIKLFERLEWYAVGNLDRVKELCASITSIGKKAAQGIGFVDHWKVEPWPEDWSVERNGELTRAVPAEVGLPRGVLASRAALRGIRPSYWHSGNQKLCWVPEVGNEKALQNSRR